MVVTLSSISQTWSLWPPGIHEKSVAKLFHGMCFFFQKRGQRHLLFDCLFLSLFCSPVFIYSKKIISRELLILTVGVRRVRVSNTGGVRCLFWHTVKKLKVTFDSFFDPYWCFQIGILSGTVVPLCALCLLYRRWILHRLMCLFFTTTVRTVILPLLP